MGPTPDASRRGVGDNLIRASRTVAETAVVAMMLFIVVDIAARSLFDVSLLISDEISGYMLVVMTFFGAADALRHGALLRIEILLFALGPRLRAGLCVVFDLLALGLMAIVLWQVTALTWSTWTRRMVAPTLLETPLWLPQLAMPIGCALLFFAFLLELRDHLRAAFGAPVDGGDRR